MTSFTPVYNFEKINIMLVYIFAQDINLAAPKTVTFN